MYANRCIQDRVPCTCKLLECFREIHDLTRYQIAVFSTTPWDSYLIRNQVWTYPPNAIIGPTLFRIPAEEIFFFIIQTYNTSILYLIVSKPMLHSVYLSGAKEESKLRWSRCLGQVILLGAISGGMVMVLNRAKGFYMGLILVWAVPFILLLW